MRFTVCEQIVDGMKLRPFYAFDIFWGFLSVLLREGLKRQGMNERTLLVLVIVNERGRSLDAKSR